MRPWPSSPVVVDGPIAVVCHVSSVFKLFMGFRWVRWFSVVDMVVFGGRYGDLRWFSVGYSDST
ncbi:uncharacterized protein G2W53_021946 [Senna tora]|uniref:Uncharacterized protein n=1 Tax=Senna tora TaxID=362788 RepID=A0A834TLV4_9FABA|nr:uncharacterized protein G2W53_021946 [Senna tora]